MESRLEMQFADKLNDNKENVSLFSSNIYDQLLISGAQISDSLYGSFTKMLFSNFSFIYLRVFCHIVFISS